MKNFIILLICVHLHVVSFAQIFNDVDEVTELQGTIIAVKKGNQWGFIDNEGAVVIDFRNDFVLSPSTNNSGVTLLYPLFKDDRCMIKKLIDDTYYFGYVNTKGEEVIKPTYLNATNFKNGYAIVILPSKDKIGYNEVLKKDIVSSKIEEFIINTSGGIVKYLENPRNNTSPKTKPKTPPVLYSKFIAPNVIAVKKKDLKWDIYKF